MWDCASLSILRALAPLCSSMEELTGSCFLDLAVDLLDPPAAQPSPSVCFIRPCLRGCLQLCTRTFLYFFPLGASSRLIVGCPL